MNRNTFFQEIAEHVPADGLEYIQRAYWLVKDAHRKQSRRLTGERYFEHVRRVAYMLCITYGYTKPETIALGLLHDVIEDTFVPPSVITNLFGQAMYEDIMVLSKELPTFNLVTGTMIARAKIKDELYYQNLLTTASRKPRLVKGCDRIDNLADLPSWEETRRIKYINETRTNVLPIVYLADVRMATEIERLLALAE